MGSGNLHHEMPRVKNVKVERPILKERLFVGKVHIMLLCEEYGVSNGLFMNLCYKV